MVATAADTKREAELPKPARAAAKPVREVGSFFALSLDTFVQLFHPPFAWREFIHQSWFVARVSLAPLILLSIPFNVLVVFILNILLVEIGAADFSGAGAALGVVTQIGPMVTVLVVAGAGATAMCADLGARTIREEIDAMRVMGINPVQRLVVPRVLALTLNGVAAERRRDASSALVGSYLLRGLLPARHSRCLRCEPDAARRAPRVDHLPSPRRRCSAWPPA